MLGFEAELWYLPFGSRPASALPTWASLDKNLLVQFCQASRTTLTISREMMDASTRCENGVIDVATYGDMGISADVEFPWEEEKMPNAVEWFNSIFYGRNVAAAVLDSQLFTDAGPVSSDMLGVWADWILAEWNHSHPMGGAQRIRFRLVPAWSGYITYGVGVPASVDRFFPELINPY